MGQCFEQNLNFLTEEISILLVSGVSKLRGWIGRVNSESERVLHRVRYNIIMSTKIIKNNYFINRNWKILYFSGDGLGSEPKFCKGLLILYAFGCIQVSDSKNKSCSVEYSKNFVVKNSSKIFENSYLKNGISTYSSYTEKLRKLAFMFFRKIQMM